MQVISDIGWTLGSPLEDALGLLEGDTPGTDSSYILLDSMFIMICLWLDWNSTKNSRAISYYFLTPKIRKTVGQKVICIQNTCCSLH